MYMLNNYILLYVNKSQNSDCGYVFGLFQTAVVVYTTSTEPCFSPLSLWPNFGRATDAVFLIAIITIH